MTIIITMIRVIKKIIIMVIYIYIYIYRRTRRWSGTLWKAVNVDASRFHVHA